MNNVLSKERVGELLPRAAVAIFLAGAVKAFIHLRGDRSFEYESGGWEPLTLGHAIDHSEFYTFKPRSLVGKDIEVVTPSAKFL